LYTASSTIGGSGGGQASDTRHSRAWLVDAMSRPTTSIRPSVRTRSVSSVDVAGA
jgi:hypothetical protein